MKKTVVLLLACVLVLSGITFAASSGYFEGFRIVNVNINGKSFVSLMKRFGMVKGCCLTLIAFNLLIGLL